MSALPESVQGVRLALGAGRGDCSNRERDGGEWETSAKMRGQAEDGNNNEHIALRQREVQEGVHNNRGGRG